MSLLATSAGLFVFTFLSISAFYFILYQSLVQTGLELQFSSICYPDVAPHPDRLEYTGHPDADRFLCGLVSFFHALMINANIPLLAVLFPVVGIVTLVPLLEASRDRRSFVLSMPTPVGVLFQLFSMGVIMPIYSLLFVITGTASVRSSSSSSKINQGNAEALLFGILVGYVLPTGLMILLTHPIMTAIWQGFPFLVAFAILAHRIIRPPSQLVQSGHPTVLVTLSLTFFLSALLHAIYVWPILTDINTMRMLFVPINVADLDPEVPLSLSDGVLQFIKWDLIFGAGSIALSTLWMADSMICLVKILVWHIVVTIAFGPAAAIAGVLFWRERRLNHAQTILQKTE